MESNNEPTFPEGTTTTRTVDENTAADVAFGDPVAATDDDSGDTLSYSLRGADSASFTIVESSGQLKTKASLDYETKASYSVEVRADDGFVVKSIAVTIDVTDVNEAPAFRDDVTTSPTVDENTAADVAFGDPVTATDPDSGAMLTYSLSGTDAASFGIVESSGQLKTKGPLNYEGPQNVYDVIVTVSDGALTDSVEVSIAVNDVKEAPGTPDAPTVEAAVTDGQTALDVTWTAPSNAGPAITDYDMQYRVADSGDDFTDASHDGVGVSTTITDLSPSTTYEVQVRATNDEDTGLWSTSGEGITDSVTRAVDENTATDVAFGDPVTAAGGGTLNYSLAGTDAASFAIVESSGQLKTKASLDYETKGQLLGGGARRRRIRGQEHRGDDRRQRRERGAGLPRRRSVPRGKRDAHVWHCSDRRRHGNTVTGQRAALLQEYVGYIQRVGPGQAGKLEPGRGRDDPGDPAQAYRGGRDAGEDPGVPPFRRRHLLLAAGGPARRNRPRKEINLGGRRLGWRSPANHPPPEDSRNEALGPRRFLDDSARRVAARRSGDAVQVPGRGIITTVARGAPPATPRYPRGRQRTVFGPIVMGRGNRPSFIHS